MKPKKEQFEMNRLKVKGGVVEYDAVLSLVEDDVTVKPVLKDKYPIEPHEDMTDLLNSLKRPLATVHGLLTFETIMDNKDFGMLPVQKSFLKQLVEDQMQKINVIGVSISGKEKTKGVTITGTYDGMAINTRSLKFVGTKYGFEEELEEICDKLEDELYLFIYENKRPKSDQLDIFSGGEKVINGTGEEFEEDYKSKAAGE